MAGQFLDFHPVKDDNLSSVSSMDDSAYMSLPDTSHHARATAACDFHAIGHLSGAQSVDTFVDNDICSPTLSAQSQGTFQGAFLDVDSVMLSQSAGSTNPGDYGTAASAASNYAYGHAYHPPAGFVFQGQATPRNFAHGSQAATGQNPWSVADSQVHARPLFVGSMDTTVLLPVAQMQAANTEFGCQPLYIPYTPALQSALLEETADIQRTSTPHQMRMRNSPCLAHPAPFAANAVRSAGVVVNGRPSQVSPVYSRRSSSAVTSHPTVGATSISSPVSTTSNPRFAAAANGVVERSHQYTGMAETESALDQSNTGSINTSTVIADDAEDDSPTGASLSASRGPNEEAARAHPLYQASPGPDDLYHCPYEAEDCMHKPTKLKCNYDKYIDSHLKPFRCKSSTCAELQFSSTACLLRHEREAHGMHGHGSKPHLCTYPDCERSLPGNGFPRRYNLFDHMKRVHDYTGSTSTPDRVASPIQAAVPTLKRDVSHKRKTTGAAESSGKRLKTAKAQTATVPTLTPQQRRAKEIQQLQTQWAERRASLQSRLQTMQGPQDITSHQQVSEDVAALQRIVGQLNDLG